MILSCVNLLAVLLWALTTDKLGRRTILLPCQTFLCFVLFTVGGLYWSGAVDGNAAAGTALVSTFLFDYHIAIERRLTHITARNLLSLDVLLPGYCHVAIRLLCRAAICYPEK